MVENAWTRCLQDLLRIERADGDGADVWWRRCWAGSGGMLNPFPKSKICTQRPDVIAAHVEEGKIAVIVDNSPTVILLPAGIFDFVQDVDDYYLPSADRATISGRCRITEHDSSSCSRRRVYLACSQKERYRALRSD